MRRKNSALALAGVVGLAALLTLALRTAAPAATSRFRFHLDRPAVTSAGVYTADGRLVRVLWLMDHTPAGDLTREWDGRDDSGNMAPPADYRYRLVTSSATYENVGAIGNSGQPPDPSGHTPDKLLSVAVDAQENSYTANGWDEAGADFKKWDADGHSVYDARYLIRNGHPNGTAYAIATDRDYLYCAVTGHPKAPWNELQQIQRFRLSDGAEAPFSGPNTQNGHITVYEWPSRQVPADAAPEDGELMKRPLRSLAVSGDNLWATDALGDRMLGYDRITGDLRTDFPVKLPHAVAIDAKRRLWVAHNHSLLTVFDSAGKAVAEPHLEAKEIVSLAFGPGDRGDQMRLYVADSAIAQVLVYRVVGDRLELETTFGQQAKPGDPEADHFYNLKGAAVDSGGNLVTIQMEPMGGARLARWSPTGRLLWEQLGLEPVSLGNYGTADPDTLYSMTFHRYALGSRVWTYEGNTFTGPTGYHGDIHGVARVLRLGDHDYYYLPSGDGVQIYRIDGPVLRLAALVGGRWPSPAGTREKERGEWTWHDVQGGSAPTPGAIQWYLRPGLKDPRMNNRGFSTGGFEVDQQGNLWFAHSGIKDIWEIPLRKFDARGNPAYDWADLREAVPADPGNIGLDPNLVQHADDGSVYALGWSDRWPRPEKNPFGMGGTTLAHYSPAGKMLWAVELPEVSVGMDAIPRGGCLVGGARSARLYHYSSDGLQIGTASPGSAMGRRSGWLDNNASVAVNRNPRDHHLDVFVEDDLVGRIAWYRIDDQSMKTLTGPLD